MSKFSPVHVLHTEGPPAFAFLVDRHRFVRPELVDDGLRYHRPGIHIEISTWWYKGERGFTTSISMSDVFRGFSFSAVDLGCLYVACGLGPVQQVGGSTGTGHVVRKRIAEHSAALRKVMPYLEGPDFLTLMRRCQGRQLPG